MRNSSLKMASNCTPPCYLPRFRFGVSLWCMAENWLEIAQKMAEAARASLARDRKRLQEILAERQQTQAPSNPASR